ncbi:MAG TPA: pyrimidine reductase family protein [Trebonia sp.]|nr:pyrimidine reductase family protein [Trebonia sp.]
MRQLLPPAPGAGQSSLDPAAISRLYAYPPGAGPWVRGNMVGSLDGAAAVDGLSGGLSSPADRQLFWILRGLADVILVGAGTARAEGYRATRGGDNWAELGLRAGRPAAPPVALVSRSLSLDPGAPLIAQAPADARTIVITCQSSPADRRKELSAVADVIMAGDESVDLSEAVAALASRGLGKILCEGGPRLLADITTAGLLAELCLTLSPVLAGSEPVRVLASSARPGPDAFHARRLQLSHLLEEDGVLFARYQPAQDT